MVQKDYVPVVMGVVVTTWHIDGIDEEVDLHARGLGGGGGGGGGEGRTSGSGGGLRERGGRVERGVETGCGVFV